MRKSVGRLYGYKRRFDYGEACESANNKQRSFVKKRAHKRLRKQFNSVCVRGVLDV